MAVPVIASSTSDTTGGTSNTSITLSAPSGLANGDLIVIIFADEQSNINDSPAVSGYTQITHSNNSQDCQLSLYWRVRDGTETWPLTVAGVSGDYAVGWALRITGADTISPIHQTGSWVGVGSTTANLAVTGVTTTLDNCLILSASSRDGSDNTTPPTTSGTGWGASPDAGLEDPSNNTGGAVGAYITKSLATAGASQTVTYAYGVADGAVGIQIAIVEIQPGISSISPAEFDMDEADVDINGINFEASQASGTVYISDADTLAGSVNEVEIDGGINTWSDTQINLDLTGLSAGELSSLQTLGPGTRYIIVVNDSSDEYGSGAITLHRPEAFVMSLGAGTPGVTTARLTAPATKTTGDFDAGRFEEAANPATAVDITLDDYTEMVWSIEAKTNSRDVSYDFRVTKSGSVIDTYTVTPQVTISGVVAYTLTADAASWGWSGAAASLLHKSILTAGAASYPWAGTAAGLNAGYLVSAEAASWPWAGSAAGFLLDSRLTAGAASWGWAGTDASLLAGYVLSAEAASYPWSGQAAGFLLDSRLTAEAASWPWAGQTASLLHDSVLTAGAASWPWAGTDATLTFTPVGAYVLTADAASWPWAGSGAGLLFDAALSAEAASWPWSGQDAGLVYVSIGGLRPGALPLLGVGI